MHDDNIAEPRRLLATLLVWLFVCFLTCVCTICQVRKKKEKKKNPCIIINYKNPYSAAI